MSKFYTINLKNLDIQSRQAEWNERYKVINIICEQNKRMKNVEYFDIFNMYLEQSFSHTVERNGVPRILELACGSAPVPRRMIEKGAFAFSN